MLLIQQSDTAHPIDILMTSSTDHVSPLTGATVTVTLSKNGAAFGAAAGAVAEVGSGIYKLTPTSADTGTLGELAIHATATGGDPADLLRQVVAFNPYDLTRLGLTALPNAIAGANNGLPLGDASGRTTVGAVATGAIVSGSFAAGAIDAGAIGTDAIGSAELAASAVAEIVAAIPDPLGVAVPGSYGSGTVGNIIGNTSTAAQLADAVKVAVWNVLTSTLTTSGSIGKLLVDNLNATISSRLASGNVTIGAYAAGQDPATLVLATPANKLATDAAGRVTVGSIISAVLDAIADALLDRTDGVETNWTLRRSARIWNAVLHGKSTNGGDTFRDPNDTKDRIVATVDSSNNRLSVTRDAA